LNAFVYLDVKLPWNLWYYYRGLGIFNFSFFQGIWESIISGFGYDYELNLGSVYWKFEDVDFNSRFVKNVYPLVFIIVFFMLLWIPVGIGLLVMKRKSSFKRFMLKIKLYMLNSTQYRLIYLVFF